MSHWAKGICKVCGSESKLRVPAGMSKRILVVCPKCLDRDQEHPVRMLANPGMERQ